MSLCPNCGSDKTEHTATVFPWPGTAYDGLGPMVEHDCKACLRSWKEDALEPEAVMAKVGVQWVAKGPEQEPVA